MPCRSYSIEIDSTNTARLRIISLTRHATLTKPPEEPPKVAEKPTSDPMVMALNAQSTALMKLSTAYASLAKWGLLAVAVLAVLILIRR